VASGGDLPAEEAAVVLHASTEGFRIAVVDGSRRRRYAALRGVIAAANETVALRSFAEQIPSMNDIFIRAVDGSLINIVNKDIVDNSLPTTYLDGRRVR